MDNNIFMMLSLQVLLIVLNAVFACAEIAVISLNENKLSVLADKGDKRASRLIKLTAQPARFLATIQVAITLSGFLGSAFAAENFSGLLVDAILKTGVNIPYSTLNTIMVILITIILSYFTLIFGELVPKRMAMRKPEALALGMSSIIYYISKIFAPIVWFLTLSTNSVLKLMGIDPNEEEENVSEEEIRMMVDAGSQKGIIAEEEKEFINNVFEFDDLTAGDIVTHRTDVSFLYLEDDMESWMNTIKNHPHALYPICDETADRVVGIFNTREFFVLDDKSFDNVMKNAVTEPYFVPEGVGADVLFRNMKATKNKIAVVLDEHGGMIGIITLVDLIEELVGDLGDLGSQLNENLPIKKIGDNTYMVSGNTLMEDILEEMGIEHESEERQNLNSYVFEILGEIPSDGTAFQLESECLNVKVTKVRRHRIESAIISPCECVKSKENELRKQSV